MPAPGDQGGRAGASAERHRQGDRVLRQAIRLRRGPRLHRPRHRPDVPFRAGDPALRRAERVHRDREGHDVHHRADDHPGRHRLGPVGRQLDGHHQGQVLDGAVRAHAGGDRVRRRGADPALSVASRPDMPREARAVAGYELATACSAGYPATDPARAAPTGYAIAGPDTEMVMLVPGSRCSPASSRQVTVVAGASSAPGRAAVTTQSWPKYSTEETTAPEPSSAATDRGCSWICSGRSISRAGPSGTTRPGVRRTSITPNAQRATSRWTTPGTVQVSPMNSAVGRSTGWSYTSRGRPTWASAPPRMIAIWSAKDSASSWSCVTNRVVTSVAANAAATSARVSARNEASSAEKGSSSRISFGSGARVLASATRCCWPPDSSCG